MRVQQLRTASLTKEQARSIAESLQLKVVQTEQVIYILSGGNIGMRWSMYNQQSPATKLLLEQIITTSTLLEAKDNIDYIINEYTKASKAIGDLL